MTSVVEKRIIIQRSVNIRGSIFRRIRSILNVKTNTKNDVQKSVRLFDKLTTLIYKITLFYVIVNG